MVSTKNKSEEKDIKLTVFYRKMVFFSSFWGNIINFVRVLLYNKVQLIWRRMENRIKVVLADKKRTNKWLSEQLECAPTTVSKWCTNSSQPPMETFVKIAEILEVDINELLRIEKKWYVFNLWQNEIHVIAKDKGVINKNTKNRKSYERTFNSKIIRSCQRPRCYF